jgi:ADP-ribose pyrophosphatase YjhB (NUDIX family)
MTIVDAQGAWRRMAAHAVCVRQGEILLARLNASEEHAGAWTLPGGGIEFGEAPEDAVVREIKEETGLDATLGRILGVYSEVVPESKRTGGPLHFVSVVYRAAVGDGDPAPQAGDDSTDDARWFRIPDAHELDLRPLAVYGMGLLADAALVAASSYGLVFEAANSQRPDVMAAREWAGWEQVLVSELVLADRVFHANEPLIERRRIDRIAPDPGTERDGNEPHIYVDADGDAHVISGIHRVAMHVALGRKTMVCRLYDVRVSGSLPNLA